MTWDGYVKRVQDLPSGRVVLVLALSPELTGLESAMIKFSAARSDQLHAFQKGDFVRVVAVYDKVASVFPSLRGKSVEVLANRGMISTDRPG